MKTVEDILQDVLVDGLSVVFCGTQPGRASAVRRAYYAGPGNRFWQTLFETGLTPRLFKPPEFAALAALGIGLTDLAKHSAGQDKDLTSEQIDLARLQTSMHRFRPGILAFTSKNAARLALGQKNVRFGPQPQSFCGIETFVLPSTSGLAVAHWDIRHWHALAMRLKEKRCHAPA